MMDKPSEEGFVAKRTKRNPADLELGVYANRDLQAKEGWESVREPWTTDHAMEYIKFPHLDRWWPTELHFKHCAARAVTYTHINDVHVKWRFLEILRAISNLEKWPKNNIPRSIAALMYAEYQLGKRVDWSTIHGRFSGGSRLGRHLSAKKPGEIPRNNAPQWFLDNPTLYDNPNDEVPLDREKIVSPRQSRGRKRRARKVEATQCKESGKHVTNEIGEGSKPLSGTMEMANATQSKAGDVPTKLDEDKYGEVQAQLEVLCMEIKRLKHGRDDDVEMVSKVRALEAEKMNLLAEVTQLHNHVNQLNNSNENYMIEVAALKRELQEIKAQHITTETTLADLQQELDELRAYREKEESARNKLKLTISKIIDEREEMMLATVFAVARTRQYEAEFKSICAEWTSENKLRTLLLTSWPRDETMYPSSWDDKDPSLMMDNNSIDWRLVAEEDHRWDIGKVHDHPAEMIGKLLWQKPHPMTSDGSSCPICDNPWGPEGCYMIGSCGHSFHPHCLIKSMIRSRACGVCRAPLHPRLYHQFGLRDIMPSHWVYRQDDYDFALEDFNGNPVEWSWRHNMSKAQLWHTFRGEELLDDPDKLVHAANEMYPDKPTDYGMKMFFYQTLGWHWNRQRNELVHGLGPPPYYNSSGERAVGDLELRRAYRDTTLVATTGTEELYWEERYHQKRLLVAALDAILDDIAPEVKEWLNGGEIPRYRQGHGRHGYRTRSNVRARDVARAPH